MAGHLISHFRSALPEITILTPESPEYASRRETRGKYGQDIVPLAIAVPKSASEVSALIKWSASQNVPVTVRSGGNDFYGRNVVEGGLMIDMREIKSISVSEDKKTIDMGGGVITKDLILKMEEEDVIVPVGNTWIVGYVGWATLGGYGPFQNYFGMGFEGIVGAELVTSEGDIVEANEEMLAGLRGLGGNLGVVTRLTVKCYPQRELFLGMLLFDATPEAVNKIIAVESEMSIPKAVTLHHFILQLQDRALATIFTWADGDIAAGQEFLDKYIASMPELRHSAVGKKTLRQHQESVPLKCLPWGGQHSMNVQSMSPKIVDILMDALKTMPAEVNMGWSAPVAIAPEILAKSCFGVGDHVFLSFSDMVAQESSLEEAARWSSGLFEKLRTSGDAAVMEGGYVSLSKPGNITGREILGDKWNRAVELKKKYDEGQLFRHAIPSLEE